MAVLKTLCSVLSPNADVMRVGLFPVLDRQRPLGSVVSPRLRGILSRIISGYPSTTYFLGAGLLALSLNSYAQPQELAQQEFDYGLNFVAPTKPAVEEQDIAAQAALVNSLEAEFGVYDSRLAEALITLGDSLKAEGEYAAAAQIYARALHLNRINQGLYHGSQEPIVERLINVEIARRNWAEVDNRYAYLELLYRRIYSMDDPRLEVGLRRVTDWHIDAFNVSVDDHPLAHLQEAHKLFKLRLEIAERTLGRDHPRVDTLSQNVSYSERQLFLRSELYREYLIGKQGITRRSYIATSD